MSENSPVPRRTVVTGAAGFIGSHLALALARSGTTVIGVDRRGPASDEAAAANLATLRGLPGYTHVTADLTACGIDPLLLHADAVFHLAAIPGVRPSWGPRFAEYVACNLLATQRLLESAARMRIPRLVVASSSSVYGTTTGRPSSEHDVPHPMSPYAVTKLAEEQLCLAYGDRDASPTRVVALRYFTVYGPRQRSDMFTHRALAAALTGEPLHLFGTGHQRRDLTYVDDVVTATIAAATAPDARGVINVGSGTSTSLLEIVNFARHLAGQDIQIRPATGRDGDPPATQADTTRALSLLGWHPTVDLHTGLRAQLLAMPQPSTTAV
ncbi:NAD-dependent epimerase/dehydratase family protein [Streptomyces acidiscabies]|uniref:NAD-dependent epimerase/dehydratase family protein n=1 Tax=Streptomyces acidiscabies TaxID=42234 RepID=UPI0021164724|nr:NAD-dependent epimerase/dehydratase family protein [Streptomyces acidiscabies]